MEESLYEFYAPIDSHTFPLVIEAVTFVGLGALGDDNLIFVCEPGLALPFQGWV